MDFQFIPHLNNAYFPKVRKENLLNAVNNLKEIDGKKLYVVDDDDGAVFWCDGKIEVFSEGEWFLV